jgi:D-glycero-D-manno-heptose 1,7-bisphosphate phosphatase
MLYCFDVDGTLVRSFMREGGAEAQDYDKVELLPDRLDRLEGCLRSSESCFAIVTNQAGVAFGYQTIEQVHQKMGRVLAAVDFFGGHPTTMHIATEHPNAKIEAYKGDAGRRKPGPKMLLEAIELHGVFVQEAVYVGDMDTDQQAAEAAGIRYIDAKIFFDR